VSRPTGHWRDDIESPSSTPLLDAARMLIRAMSVVIGFYALVFLVFALNAGHYGRAATYGLYLVACAVANGAVELAIRRRRPGG
jgi:hypothetical protein